jgi:hypothetical protein
MKPDWAFSPGESTIYQNIVSRLPSGAAEWYIFLEPYGIGDCLLNLSLFGNFKETYCRHGEKICYVTTTSLGKLKPFFSKDVDIWLTFDNPIVLFLYNELISHRYELRTANPISLAPTTYYKSSKLMNSAISELDVGFKRLLLGLPASAPTRKSVTAFSNLDSKNLEEKFFNDICQPENTILIIPHAQSCSRLPEWYWNILVSGFKTAGFNIYFDIFNFYNVAPEGARGVKLAFDEIIYLSQHVAATVSYRSGLTDLIANSTSKEHYCLYPSKDLLLHGYAKCSDVKKTTTNDFFGFVVENSFFDTISKETSESDPIVISGLQRVVEIVLSKVEKAGVAR